MSAPAATGRFLSLRSFGGFFLVVVIPIVHAAGGFFILDFLLSGQYTWGRTLRTFVLLMTNLVLAYEFVYRDLQARHPDWPDQRLLKSVLTFSIFPFCVGMAALVLLLGVTRLLR
jgi:hypothetical protein